MIGIVSFNNIYKLNTSDINSGLSEGMNIITICGLNDKMYLYACKNVPGVRRIKSNSVLNESDTINIVGLSTSGYCNGCFNLPIYR